MEPMRTIDIAALIDRRKLSTFNYRLIVVSWIITFLDGLDMTMVSYTAPYMRDELHLTNEMLGTVFAAGTAGMMIGGVIFAYVADRIGRRSTAIFTSFGFALLTIATAAAQTYPQLVILRFLDGLVIGGILPIAWALNIEFVPVRMRATVVTIIMVGYALGSSAGAPLTNWIAPVYGWQGVYLTAGVITLFGAIALAVELPESVRFLISRNINPNLVVATLKRLDPTIDVAADDKLILGDEPAAKSKFKLSDLFTGSLKIITPMLWLGFLASSLIIYTLSNWQPMILEELGTRRETAALISSIAILLGALAGIPLMLAHSRLGLTFVAVIPAIATGVLLMVGFGLVPPFLFLSAVVLQKMLVSASHMAILSISGTFYPSAIRASGGGWAASVAKIGAVAGPITAAFILSSDLPLLRSFAIIAICPATLCVCMLIIASAERRSRRSEQTNLAAV